jgi:hypothetical protein
MRKNQRQNNFMKHCAWSNISLRFRVHNRTKFIISEGISAKVWDVGAKLHKYKTSFLQLEDGVQPLEAMLYTLELINMDPDLLPGIKLGMIAYDSCDSPAYALEQTLDIIKGMTPIADLDISS